MPKILEWVDGQKVIRDAVIGELDAQSAAPSSCSPLQMRRALRQLGYKAAVDAYIAQQTEEIQEAWEYATVIERSDPLMADAIALLSAQLGVDSQATGDALFTLAITL